MKSIVVTIRLKEDVYTLLQGKAGQGSVADYIKEIIKVYTLEPKTDATPSTRSAKWEELQKPLPKRRASPTESNCIGLVKPCPRCHARDGHPSGFCHMV